MMKKNPFLMFRTITILLIVSFMGLSANASNKPARHYIITELGAVGDGLTVNTLVIQAAIDKCSAEGGGVIVVPDGNFLTGAIFLKQGVNLYLEKGGILKGSVNQSDYPQINTRWEGEERIWTSALINIIDVNNVKIYGEGTIDGSGTEWPGFDSRSRQQRQQLSQAAIDSIR